MIAWKNGFSNSYVTSPKIKTINKQKKVKLENLQRVETNLPNLI